MGILAGPLAAMLPSRDQTAFLRCCLAEGDTLERAWHGWQERVPDTPAWLQGEGGPLRGHLPRLHENLTAHGVAVSLDLHPYLKMATVRERRRWGSWARCAGDALGGLASAGVDATILAGAAVPALVGDAPHLRHCHDLDLWILDEELDRAVTALAAEGHVVAAVRAGTTRMDHPVGLPVLLHTVLVPTQGWTLPADDLRGRRPEVFLGRHAGRTLSAPDLLVHVGAIAASRARRPHANWVVDAHRIGRGLADADWQTVAEVIDRARLTLPLAVLLGYLRDELSLAVPPWLGEELDARARRASADEQRRALEGARHGVPGGLRAMVCRSGPRAAVTVARRLRPARAGG